MNTTAKIIKPDNIEVEITIKATAKEWKEFIEVLREIERYPVYHFKNSIKEVVNKLEANVGHFEEMSIKV